jgi:lipid II:glycine glycyltransferase (peptidoglycan interpeptide bridge formation enzyme)
MLYHRQDALYAYGASVSDRKALRARPNDLLFWRAIRDSCQAGFKNFDFGLTPLENRGLLRYKSQWKARTSLVVYSYYSKSRKPIAYIDRSGPAVRLATALLKKMPKTFLKVTGPLLLRLVG